MYKLKRSPAKLQEAYKSFNVYECPEKPTDTGKFVCNTPLIKLAVVVVNRAEEEGKSYFIKGVKEDGTEVLLL